MNTRELLTAIAVASAVALSSAPAGAQATARGFAVNRFEPSEPGSDWFVNESLDFRGGPRPAFGAVFDWAYRPLVLRDPQGEPRADVITDQVFVHAGASVTALDRLRLAANLPIALFQDGENVAPFTAT